MVTLLEEHFEGGVLGGDAVTMFEDADPTPRPDQNIGFTAHTVNSGGPGISDAPIFVTGRTGLGITDTTEAGGRNQTLQFVVDAPSGILYVSGWYLVTDSMTATTYRMVEIRDDDGRFVTITHNPFDSGGSIQAQITGATTVKGALPLGEWVQFQAWYDPAGTARVKVGDILDTGDVAAPAGRDVSMVYFVVTNGSGTTYTLDDVLISIEAVVDETVTYRRIFPRDDGLAGGTPRNYPPSKARRTSGGYL